MKKYIIQSIRMTLVLTLLLCVIYPMLIAFAGKLSKGGGDGETIVVNGKVVGYAAVGQKFDKPQYFWGRPSAVGYNAAGSGGSNKGPSNPDYLKDVQSRIDTFLVHNLGIKKEDIPSELVTASGGGLDPDLSPEGAKVQVKRVAAVRHISEEKIAGLVKQYVQPPFLGLFGTERVNVLKLNMALDEFK